MKIHLRKKLEEKWGIIDCAKYPYDDMNEFIVEKFSPSMKVGYYKKDDVMCFYFRHGTIFMLPAFWHKADISVSSIYFDVMYEIKKYLIENSFIGKVGFECCELEQLNRVSEIMIKKYGYNTKREDGFVYVNFDYNDFGQNFKRDSEYWKRHDEETEKATLGKRTYINKKQD